MNHKKKIAEYLNIKGISKSKFCLECKFSSGFFKSGDNFGSDKLVIIAENYLDLNLNWLIFDKGNMILNEGVSNELDSKNAIVKDSKMLYNTDCKNCIELEKRIDVQAEFIDTLKENNKALILKLNG